MLVAEQQFQRIIGYHDRAKLVSAVERRTARITHRTNTAVAHIQVAEAVTI